MRGVQILLADDDEDDRSFFREALTEAAISAELITVEDGRQLTDYLSATENPPPDIIFLDINMPLKNGKICLREIRNNEKFNDTPVVMFSTSSHPNDIAETWADGANLYIIKFEFFGHEVNMLKSVFSANWQKELFLRSKENFILKAGE